MFDLDAVRPLALRATGPLNTLDRSARDALMSRGASDMRFEPPHTEEDLTRSLRERTRTLIARVRAEGDDALMALAREFDGAGDSFVLEVPRAHWQQALDTLDPMLRDAMERSARNIAAVHRAFMPAPAQVSPEPGIVVGRRPDPLGRVGVYAPGGRAAYPSSLLMGAIPARIAGVEEVVVCSPPSPSGRPSPVVLAAAALANVDRVFAVGGAGAIAAMAYGTATVPRVDRIVGPGNAYVAEAKLQLVSQVAIDAPAGPSELLIIADDAADLRVAARELVAQAEHDPDAACIALLAGSQAVRRANELMAQLQAHVLETPRADIVRASLAFRGAVLLTDLLDDAIAFANAWAAEHLLLLVDEPQLTNALAAIRAAGTVFVGPHSSVAFGDYMTGANHVLPTAGAGRSYSGLSTLDFVRWTTWQRVDRDAASRLADDVARFADAEGLPAHAAAARAWSTATDLTDSR